MHSHFDIVIIMNLQQIFAHGGQKHINTAEAVEHYVAPWYVAVPIFICVIVILAYFVWRVSGRKLNTLVLVLTPILLISGLALYDISTFVSVISVTLGLILCVYLVIIKISPDSDN